MRGKKLKLYREHRQKKTMGSASDPHDFSVVMLPWLAYGHVSPYLELAKRLSRHNILVHFCSTPVNLASIAGQFDSGAYPSIRPLELHLPTLPGLPPYLHTTRYLPSHLMPVLKQAFDMAEPNFERLLERLKPDLVIYDFIQPWAPSAARRQNIPAVQFLPAGAASSCFFSHYYKTSTEEFPFPAIRLGPGRNDRDHVTTVDRVANGISDGERVSWCMERSSSFIAIKSCREIEADYIDYLSTLLGKEVVPVGPLLPEEENEDDDRTTFVNGNVLKSERPITEWLNSKKDSSVVFVSFGSEYFMSKEELEEVARGLEQSGVDFIWVVRFSKEEVVKEDNTSNSSQWAGALPSGFMTRVKEGDRGLVVEGWAPQRKILAHRSVGGFLTHCGWSSVLEAIKYGVPIVALPLQLDQPINAKLVVELGVGAEIRKVFGGVRPGFRREEVADGIREVVVGQEGAGLKQKAKKMAEVICSKGDEQIKVVVEKLRGLCGKVTRSESDRIIT